MLKLELPFSTFLYFFLPGFQNIMIIYLNIVLHIFIEIFQWYKVLCRALGSSLFWLGFSFYEVLGQKRGYILFLFWLPHTLLTLPLVLTPVKKDDNLISCILREILNRSRILIRLRWSFKPSFSFPLTLSPNESKCNGFHEFFKNTLKIDTPFQFCLE